MISAVRSQVHHLALSVPDLDATSQWYQDTLDFREEYRYAVPEMDLQAAFLVRDGLCLELFQVVGSRPAAPEEQDLGRYLGMQGLKHVAFAVDDIDEARSALVDRGVVFANEVTTVPNSGGARFCLFADHDGVLMELFEDPAGEPAPSG